MNASHRLSTADVFVVAVALRKSTAGLLDGGIQSWFLPQLSVFGWQRTHPSIELYCSGPKRILAGSWSQERLASRRRATSLLSAGDSVSGVAS